MARPLDDPEARVRDACRQQRLALGREQEVVVAGQYQCGNGDLAEPIHDAPAAHHLSAEGQCLWPGLHTPGAGKHPASRPHDAEAMVVRRHQPERGSNEVLRNDATAIEAPRDCHSLGVIAAVRQDLRRVLLRPASVPGGVEKDEARHALGVPQGIFERNVATERMAEDGPSFEAQHLAKLVGIRRQVLPRHRCDRRAGRTPVAAVVVEDEGVPVREPPEWRQRYMIEPRPAMHEQQWVPMPHDVHVQGHITDGHLRHGAGPRAAHPCCVTIDRRARPAVGEVPFDPFIESLGEGEPKR